MSVHRKVSVINYFRDPITFVTGKDKYNIQHLSRVFNLVQSIIVLGKAKKEYQNIKYALKLFNVIIETLKGKIDEAVKEILKFLLNEISVNNIKQGYKISLLESVKLFLIFLDCRLLFL